MAAGDALERWAAEARADDAIAQRVRETSLRRQARDDISLAAAAADLAEHASGVQVTVDGGTVVRGLVQAVGADHLDVIAPGWRALVPLGAVVLLEGSPDRPLRAAGDRVADATNTLVGALAELADDRADVRVELRSGVAAVHGRLTRAGHDVLVVEREQHGPTLVALHAVTVIWSAQA